MKLRKLALACAAVPVALFLTGCGSDDDSSSSGVQVYSNGFGGTDVTSLPVNYYNVSGSSYTASSANPVLANLYDDDGIVAGSQVSNGLPVDTRIAFIGANIDAVSGSGAYVLVNYAVGANNALSDLDVTTVSPTSSLTVTYVGQAALGMHTVTAGTRAFAVVTGAGIDGIDGAESDGSSLGVLVPSGNTLDGTATVAQYALATSGGFTNNSYDTIAVSSNTTPQVNPVVYMGDFGDGSVQACTLSFTDNFIPSIAQTGDTTCVDKTVVGNINNQATFIFGLAVAQNTTNVLIGGYDVNGNSTLWNCPAANWTLDNNCTAVSVTYPDGTTGQQIGQIFLNANRDTILIETLTNAGAGALVSCSINSDGTEITNCQLPRLDGSSTGAVLDVNDNQNLVY